MDSELEEVIQISDLISEGETHTYYLMGFVCKLQKQRCKALILVTLVYGLYQL